MTLDLLLTFAVDIYVLFIRLSRCQEYVFCIRFTWKMSSFDTYNSFILGVKQQNLRRVFKNESNGGDQMRFTAFKFQKFV